MPVGLDGGYGSRIRAYGGCMWVSRRRLPGIDVRLHHLHVNVLCSGLTD